MCSAQQLYSIRTLHHSIPSNREKQNKNCVLNKIIMLDFGVDSVSYSYYLPPFVLLLGRGARRCETTQREKKPRATRHEDATKHTDISMPLKLQ